MPITYVPARNTVFLALLTGLAEVVGARHLVIGVNAQDYSGYPDCQPQFLHAFAEVARLGTRVGAEGGRFEIHAPLLHLSKAGIVRRASARPGARADAFVLRPAGAVRALRRLRRLPPAPRRLRRGRRCRSHGVPSLARISHRGWSRAAGWAEDAGGWGSIVAVGMVSAPNPEPGTQRGKLRRRSGASVKRWLAPTLPRTSTSLPVTGSAGRLRETSGELRGPDRPWISGRGDGRERRARTGRGGPGGC